MGNFNASKDFTNDYLRLQKFSNICENITIESFKEPSSKFLHLIEEKYLEQKENKT